jgi:hypothetical protein
MTGETQSFRQKAAGNKGEESMIYHNRRRHAPLRAVRALSRHAQIKIGAITAVLGFAALGLMAGAASAATVTTTGGWVLDPPQSVSTSTSTATSSVYQAQVQQPINADGSSSWPSNRGVVPVQFTLQKATQATTTTTTTTGPVIFQSLKSAQGTGTPGQEFSNLTFTPGSLTFGQITNLSANFSFSSGDNYGGSPRWSIVVNDNGTDKTVYVYYGGSSPFIGGGSADYGQNVALQDSNVELASVTPGTYGSWANAMTLYQNDPVVYAALVVDSGWNVDQVITLNSAAVNDNTWTPAPVGTTTSSPSITGGYAPDTTDTAYIHVYKVSSSDAILADETTDSAQPDNTGIFRQVDGKYIYNLALSGYGVGRYEAVMRIGGNDASHDVLSSPAYFGLR